MPSDEEALQLKAQIDGIARMVATRCNASRTVRDRLYEDATGHVFAVLHAFDRQRGAFSTWCYTVLHNHCVSLIRAESQERKYLEHARDAARVEDERRRLEKPAPSAIEEREQRMPRAQLVAAFDRHLEPLDRLLVAAYEGLLQRFGTDVCDSWCRAAGRSDSAAWHDIEAKPQGQRKKALAALLGESLAWVRTRIWRAMQALKQALTDEEAP
jgi:RNA polymerase sigma factor (sigma-70 family)